MPGKLLISTAYLPPIEYISHICKADEVLIEKEENYLKQSYRNRCYILAADGSHTLTVPVYLGSFHKTPIREIRVDYSKRWQQIHLRAIQSSYGSSPYFLYYYETIEKIIFSRYEFLIDLNLELLRVLLEFIKIDVILSYTTEFKPASGDDNDLRYTMTPKKRSAYTPMKYIQVFTSIKQSGPGLSIIDLLFNTGPEAISYL
jgi:hypothetical protein